jgi:hypothetical protein
MLQVSMKVVVRQAFTKSTEICVRNSQRLHLIVPVWNLYLDTVRADVVIYLAKGSRGVWNVRLKILKVCICRILAAVVKGS